MTTEPAPYYQDGSVRLFHGDCLDILPELPDNSVDAVVTDPPYNLSFMGAQWDSFGGQRNGGIRGGTSDKGILPGYGRGGTNADVVQFKQRGARAFQAWCEQWAAECLRILKPGGHLLAFGGTRTSHRLACAVEDAGFEIRDSIAWLYGSGFPKSANVGRAIDVGLCRRAGSHLDDPEHVCPATPEGDEWRGHGSALKPAHEPIVVARKPLAGTVAANVLRWGTGALNIDAGRIGAGEVVPGGGSPTAKGSMYSREVQASHGYRPDGDPFHAQNNQAPPHTQGRWPANVALDEFAAAALDQMSGDRPSSGGAAFGTGGYGGDVGSPEWGQNDGRQIGFGDSGGASRFFYTAKASSDERITHNGTAHPTVKPLSLMRWLVRLVTPPGGTILEPFAGSGTTVEAALLEGFRCIAIEREADYLPLITQRINRRRDPIAYLTAAGEDLGLFGDEDEAPSQPQGRWPANVVLDRSQAEALDQMSGKLSPHHPGTQCGNRDVSGVCLGHKNAGRSTSGETFHGAEVGGVNEGGSASRFFKVIDEEV